MNVVVRWLRRIGAVLAACLAALLVPAAAWAQTAPTAQTASAPLAKGKGIAVVGGLSLLCCLVVVGIIAGIVVLIVRRRR